MTVVIAICAAGALWCALCNLNGMDKDAGLLRRGGHVLVAVGSFGVLIGCASSPATYYGAWAVAVGLVMLLLEPRSRGAVQ